MKLLPLILIGLMLLVGSCSRNLPAARTMSFADGMYIQLVPQRDGANVDGIEFKKDGTVRRFSGYEERGVTLQEIVSPNEEWILLSQTPWGDFLFCRRVSIIDCLGDQTRFSRITEGSDHVVGFAFNRWTAPSRFVMTFAFNNEEEEWEIDLDNKKTSKLGQGMARFEPKFE